MKITINAERRTTLLRWLKKETATLNDMPELVKRLNDWARLNLGDSLTLKLERQEKIMLLRWLKNGVIDVDNITKSLPTFAELLQETGSIGNEQPTNLE